MAVTRFLKVTTLPATLVADAFYFVENGTYAESYITDSAGVAKSIGNSAMINALIDSKLATAESMQIVADIAARDALTLTKNTMVLVKDASADATVDSGAALYAYEHANTSYSKIAEYESLDAVINWSNIQGKPSSTPAAIDTAVSNSHTHANSSQLAKIGEDGNGDLTYDGESVMKITADW